MPKELDFDFVLRDCKRTCKFICKKLEREWPLMKVQHVYSLEFGRKSWSDFISLFRDYPCYWSNLLNINATVRDNIRKLSKTQVIEYFNFLEDCYV